MAALFAPPLVESFALIPMGTGRHTRWVKSTRIAEEATTPRSMSDVRIGCAYRVQAHSMWNRAESQKRSARVRESEQSP